MNRTRQVLWASALSGGSVFVATAAVLALFKLATNHLSMTEYGMLVLVQFWADALNILANLGLAVSLPRIVAAAPAEDRHALVAAALGGTTLVAASAVALLGTGMAVAFASGAPWVLLAAWVLPLFFIGVLRDTALAALAGLHRYSSRAISLIVASVLSVGIAGVLVALGHASVGAFAAALVLGHALNLIWLFAALPRGARWQWNAPRFRSTLRTSKALYHNQSLNFLYQRLDILLAERLLSIEAVSMLGAVKQFPVLLSRVIGALLVPLLPNLAALVATGEMATAAAVMNRALRLVGVLGYAAVLLSAGLAVPLLTLVSTKYYAIAAPLVLWLMTAMALAVQAGIAGQGLIALGRATLITRSNIAMAIVSVALNLACLPLFGYKGAGYSAVAATIVGAALQAAFVHRSGLRIAWRPLATIQGCFIVLCGAALTTPWPAHALVAAAFVFPAACMGLGGLPWTELRALAEAVPGLRRLIVQRR